jgi:hypothetical protein
VLKLNLSFCCFKLPAKPHRRWMQPYTHVTIFRSNRKNNSHFITEWKCQFQRAWQLHSITDTKNSKISTKVMNRHRQSTCLFSIPSPRPNCWLENSRNMDIHLCKLFPASVVSTCLFWSSLGNTWTTDFKIHSQSTQRFQNICIRPEDESGASSRNTVF